MDPLTIQIIIHAVLAAGLTALFLWQFIRKKEIYQLIFVIWIPTTLLRYVSSDPTFTKILGVVQIIFFLAVIFFLFRRKKVDGNSAGPGLMELLNQMDQAGTPPAEPSAPKTEKPDQENGEEPAPEAEKQESPSQQGE